MLPAAKQPWRVEQSTARYAFDSILLQTVESYCGSNGLLSGGEISVVPWPRQEEASNAFVIYDD